METDILLLEEWNVVTSMLSRISHYLEDWRIQQDVRQIYIITLKQLQAKKLAFWEINHDILERKGIKKPIIALNKA